MNSTSQAPEWTESVAETVNGPIRYRETGSGQPLLFIHGFVNDGTLWDGLADRLRGEYRCILPDWPFGSHSLPMNPEADLSPGGIARTIDSLMSAIDLDRAAIVGNDSGGAMSQVFAVAYPDRVSHLILTNCDAFENFPPKGFRFLVALAKAPGGMDLIAYSLRLEASRRSPLGFGRLTRDRIPSQTLERWVGPLIRDSGIRRDAAKYVRGMDKRITLEAAAKLADFEAPALVVWGDADTVFPRDYGRRLSEVIPGAKLSSIPGAKTYVMLDEPDATAEAVAEFMTACAP